MIACRREGIDTLDMTRPLCPYPQVAKYTSVGSTNDAANFVCQAPPVPAPTIPRWQPVAEVVPRAARHGEISHRVTETQRNKKNLCASQAVRTSTTACRL